MGVVKIQDETIFTEATPQFNQLSSKCVVCYVSISFTSGGEEVADFHKFPETAFIPCMYITSKRLLIEVLKL